MDPALGVGVSAILASVATERASRPRVIAPSQRHATLSSALRPHSDVASIGMLAEPVAR